LLCGDAAICTATGESLASARSVRRAGDTDQAQPNAPRSVRQLVRVTTRQCDAQVKRWTII
jgi:hypothetical protein